MPAADSIVTGNAEQDTIDFRGWLVDHFVPPALGLRSTDMVEVKWGVHPVGDLRADWGANDATTFSVLVRGCSRYEFTNGRSVVLERPGGCAIWAAGVAHRWYVQREDTVAFTVRWPSEKPPA